MIHDVIGNISSVWPRIGLVLFLIFFAVVVIWAMRGSRNRFDHESCLPFEGDDFENAACEPERRRHE